MRALFLMLLCSCTPGKEAATAPVAPDPPPAVEAPAPVEPVDDCVSRCQQANAMRAVAWEVIEADCAAQCGREPATPLGTQELESR